MSDTYSGDLSRASYLVNAKDPDWEHIITPGFQKHSTSTENSLLTRTLHTADGVRALQTYVKRTKQPQHANPVTQAQLERRVQQEGDVVTEVLMLISLGNGVNGIKDVCHGGVISTLFDEVTCLLAAQVFGRYNIISVGLNVAFKRSITTPAILVCRAYLHVGDLADIENKNKKSGRSGREKVLVEGRMEDISGQVYATAIVICVTRSQKL